MKIRASLFISCVIFAGVLSVANGQGHDQRITIRFDNIPLRAALDTLIGRYGVTIAYIDSMVEGSSISGLCNDCSIDDALSTVLRGTGLLWRHRGDQYVLVRKPPEEPQLFSTILGTVTDSVSGEVLHDVNILLRVDSTSDRPARWCKTNGFGFYSLPRIVPGRYELVAQAVGRQPASVTIDVSPLSDLRTDLRLAQRDILLQEVTVEANRLAPLPLAELSGGIYIKGAPSDHDLTLIDGVRIYNPSHLGDLLNTFNPEAFEDVQMSPGGIPAVYGERIGGILDVSLREGTRDRLSGSAGLGLINSHVMLEGPVAGAGTFILSARSAYPDLVLGELHPGKRNSRLHYNDIVGKGSYQLSADDRVFISGYLSRDTYSNMVTSAPISLQNSFSWGNSAATVRLAHVASKTLFVTASAAFTRYEVDATQLWSMSAPGLSLSFPSHASITDAWVGIHGEVFPDGDHTVRGGVVITRHAINAGISGFTSQLEDLSIPDESPWEVSGYVEDRWLVSDRLSAELGIRSTYFTSSKGSRSAFDPRLLISYDLGNGVGLHSSLSFVTQFMHPFENSGIFLFYPINFWYASSDAIRPSRSFQVSVGTKAFLAGPNEVSAEAYYRHTDGVHEFIFTPAVVSVSDVGQSLIVGSGRAYGLSLLWRNHGERFSGWVSYNLSWTRNRFAEINGGREYYPRLDRRHEVSASIGYAFSRHWQLGLAIFFASSQAELPQPLPGASGGPISPADQTGLASRTNFAELNGARLPGFERLDISVLYLFDWLGLPFEAAMHLMNAYGTIDPYNWSVRDNADPRLRWHVDVTRPSMFPLFPTASLSFRF